MKRILVTGATGFVGGHLIEYLSASSDHEIHGISRQNNSERLFSRKIKLHEVDLQDKKKLQNVINEVKPHEVYHLAAQANVPKSISDPITTFHINIDSQVNLFEALLKENLKETKILIISSAEVYGYVQPSDLPIDEDTKYRPANPYAVSKIAQDYLGFQYYLTYKIPIFRVRPFNHAGPGQSLGFVMSDFASQIAEIEMKKREPVIKVGNLTAKRDFTDVRDIVKLYPLLLEKGTAGEVYNAGSGTSHSAQEILDLLLSMTNVKVKVDKDISRMRPSDIPEIVADISKVSTTTGWKPEIPFIQTVRETLEYFRNVV